TVHSVALPVEPEAGFGEGDAGRTTYEEVGARSAAKATREKNVASADPRGGGGERVEVGPHDFAEPRKEAARVFLERVGRVLVPFDGDSRPKSRSLDAEG